jgi:HPt (histidine-containing phosphotransfer) domain-containing protein
VALLRADGGWPEIVQAFAEYAPDAIAEIEAALGAGTKEALYAAAHKLKGCCANLGLLRLAAHAAALEAAAERPAGRLGPRLAGDLRQVAAASVRALEAG